MSAPRAAIVSIGEELLEGRIVDTNSSHFAALLLRQGCLVERMVTIGDGAGALHALLTEMAADWDIVLCTGGLGPTGDDRVRQEVAQWLGVSLAAVPGAEEDLRALYLRQHGGDPPEHYLRQGYVPDGARPLSNPAGTAWGFAVDLPPRARLYALPGPPPECQATFDQGEGLLDLRERFGTGKGLAFRSFHAAGVPESAVEARIREFLLARRNPSVGIIAGAHQVTVSLKARAEANRSADDLLEQASDEIRARLGDLLWGVDEQSLEEVVVTLLRERGQTLALAESCTGGRLGARITAVAGASAVLRYGWVTYADEAKIRQLGVPDAILAQHGAVSAPVAEAMARGARDQAQADWAISITGIAGPGGGSEEKPVGLVYLGLAGPDGSFAIRRRQFARAGREAVQDQSVRDALEALRRELLGQPRLPERH